jgi:hypothetical protein
MPGRVRPTDLVSSSSGNDRTVFCRCQCRLYPLFVRDSRRDPNEPSANSMMLAGRRSNDGRSLLLSVVMRFPHRRIVARSSVVGCVGCNGQIDPVRFGLVSFFRRRALCRAISDPSFLVVVVGTVRSGSSLLPLRVAACYLCYKYKSLLSLASLLPLETLPLQ